MYNKEECMVKQLTRLVKAKNLLTNQSLQTASHDDCNYTIQSSVFVKILLFILIIKPDCSVPFEVEVSFILIPRLRHLVDLVAASA